MTHHRLVWTCCMALSAASWALLVPLEARAFSSCDFESVSPIAFGNYNPFAGTNVDASTSFRYRCNGPDDTVLISLSRGSAPSFNPRTLKKGVDTLDYNLFTTAARTVIWGDGSGGTSTVAQPSNNNTAYTLFIYGRIPSGQNPKVGSYADTVVITLTF